MYEIILYDTEDERCPVQELLDSLEPKLLAKTLRTIDLLEMNGPLLREPYSKPLENGIFELRAKQGSDITRVLYFFIVGKKAVLTNGFIKKSQKTPKSTLGYDPMSADEKKPEVTPTATPTPKPTATLILAAIICSDSVFCKRNKKY